MRRFINCVQMSLKYRNINIAHACPHTIIMLEQQRLKPHMHTKRHEATANRRMKSTVNTDKCRLPTPNVRAKQTQDYSAHGESQGTENYHRQKQFNVQKNNLWQTKKTMKLSLNKRVHFKQNPKHATHTEGKQFDKTQLYAHATPNEEQLYAQIDTRLLQEAPTLHSNQRVPGALFKPVQDNYDVQHLRMRYRSARPKQITPNQDKQSN